jgi:hypothetical protein
MANDVRETDWNLLSLGLGTSLDFPKAISQRPLKTFVELLLVLE